MKYVVILVLLLGFNTPVYAGEVDGKGLLCWITNEEGTEYRSLVVKVVYFTAGWAHDVHLEDIEIVVRPEAEYTTTTATIDWIVEWGGDTEDIFDIPGWSSQSLDRRTLFLEDKYLIEGAASGSNYFRCRVTDWDGILEHFQPEIDALGEAAKNNKI